MTSPNILAVLLCVIIIWGFYGPEVCVCSPICLMAGVVHDAEKWETPIWGQARYYDWQSPAGAVRHSPALRNVKLHRQSLFMATVKRNPDFLFCCPERIFKMLLSSADNRRLIYEIINAADRVWTKKKPGRCGGGLQIGWKWWFSSIH